MKFKTILASDIAVLDSNVKTGGGTDDTAALQAALDEAGEDTGVRLIMDGAALITGLKLKSNTVIECLSKDCGFYLKDWSDCAVVSNYDMDMHVLNTRNISLIGGTYNQNCINQVHDRPMRPGEEKIVINDGINTPNKWIFCIEFYGVKNLLIRDIEIVDHRTFGITVGGFKNVTIENVWFTLDHYMNANNQDGLHFWGPGQFLTIKNVGGTVGDDFINVGSDEWDTFSSITDVLIDGVFLDHADQAIRLLSRCDGWLDRITVRNVTGTYRCIGFYINTWFEDRGFGHFGDILFENINLKAEDHAYDYCNPFLFSVGCSIDCLTLKNIRHINNSDNMPLLTVGYPYGRDEVPENYMDMRHKNIIIDGLTIIEENSTKAPDYIQIHTPVENLTVKNVTVRREGENAGTGHLIQIDKAGSADLCIFRDAYISGLDAVIDGENKIKNLIKSDIVVAK